MTVFMQLFFGSTLLGLCSLFHVLCLVGAATVLARIGRRLAGVPAGARSVFFIAGATAALVLAHTVEVWTWAFSLVALGAIPRLPEAVYFALVTYTTVGYGDVTLGPEFRVFGAMAAVTGLLAFGLSTAFLVAIVTRHFPNAHPH